MAKSDGSEIGTIIGLGVAGFGVYWLGTVFGWWGTSATTATATTTPTTTGTTATTAATPSATVTMQGTPTTTLNNALQALFVINGAPAQSIAVIPGGDAYNGNGVDITSTLAAEGITPAQLYSMMQAAMPASAPASSSTSSSSSSSTSAANTTTPTLYRGPGARTTNPIVLKRLPVKRGTSGYGMGGPMVFATRRNYVPRGSGF